MIRISGYWVEKVKIHLIVIKTNWSAEVVVDVGNIYLRPAFFFGALA